MQCVSPGDQCVQFGAQFYVKEFQLPIPTIGGDAGGRRENEEELAQRRRGAEGLRLGNALMVVFLVDVELEIVNLKALSAKAPYRDGSPGRP